MKKILTITFLSVAALTSQIQSQTNQEHLTLNFTCDANVAKQVTNNANPKVQLDLINLGLDQGTCKSAPR